MRGDGPQPSRRAPGFGLPQVPARAEVAAGAGRSWAAAITGGSGASIGGPTRSRMVARAAMEAPAADGDRSAVGKACRRRLTAGGCSTMAGGCSTTSRPAARARATDTARTARPPPTSKARISSNSVPSQPCRATASFARCRHGGDPWATGPRQSAAAGARSRGRANRRCPAVAAPARWPHRLAADRRGHASARAVARPRPRVVGATPRRASVPGGHRPPLCAPPAACAQTANPGLPPRCCRQRPRTRSRGRRAGDRRRPGHARARRASAPGCCATRPFSQLAQGLPRGGIAPCAAQQDRRQWHWPRR